MSTPWLVEAAALSKSFWVRQGFLARERRFYAVRDVDFTVRRAEVVGVVGESGCGKSTLGRLLLRLLTPTAGQILFAGEDIASLPAKSLRDLRPRMQMVFQDPFGSLDPRRRIGTQIADGIGFRRHRRRTARPRGRPAAPGRARHASRRPSAA